MADERGTRCDGCVRTEPKHQAGDCFGRDANPEMTLRIYGTPAQAYPGALRTWRCTISLPGGTTTDTCVTELDLDRQMNRRT